LQILLIGNVSLPVVFTIERLLNNDTKSCIKVIKTLRIYDQNTLRETKAILLEEINVKKYSIENYEYKSTLLHFKSSIYFYRRIKDNYRLFKYDYNTE